MTEQGNAKKKPLGEKEDVHPLTHGQVSGADQRAQEGGPQTGGSQPDHDKDDK